MIFAVLTSWSVPLICTIAVATALQAMAFPQGSTQI